MKKLLDIPFTKTISPPPDLPEGRLPTLQERRDSEGGERPARRAPRKPSPDMKQPKGKQPRFVGRDGHIHEPITHYLGKPSPIFRAKRKSLQKIGDGISSEEVKQALIGGDRRLGLADKGMPTLAERFLAEGMAAYGKKFAKKIKAKPASQS